ncbi:MAG TPA: BTAD domain-containing putative transcriptional regulator [Nocardioides sp.]|uniref:AfsR/SARP family transcriptional regulator n=1 Tax=Nocardioides sp. TaxID=35761 RepID=UPI002E32ED38|nr:BTAD domain-containing putative transcriptional regulator [Nocardioides sp.]HEX5087114.1 BTAD domain-containing putative transcriptional regulator [Nocardioides sp.]
MGRWQLVADGEDVGLGHREERLTALLGLTGHSSRLHVAGILWPESTDARALASLRRAVLQTQQRCPGLLQADRLTIGLAAHVEVDVDDVRRAAATTEDAIAQGEAGALLGRLVGEELLPDWYDDWVGPERERLQQLRVKALERIARQALDAGDLELSAEVARAASDIDPLLEWAGELAIRAHLGRGDLGSALLEFERYRDALREELDVPPSRTIRELIEPALTESRTRPALAAPAEPVDPAPAEPVDPAPAAPADPAPVAEVRGRSRPSLEAPEAPVHPAPVAEVRGRSRPSLEASAAKATKPGLTAAPVTAAPAADQTLPIPRRPRQPDVTNGRRGIVVRLLGVAALILVAALAVAGAGPLHDAGITSDPGRTGTTGGTGASGVTAQPQEREVQADDAIGPVQMAVRVVDSAVGRAAFLVRTTAQPALVRLEVSGDAGWSMVRSVLVRSPSGRRLELSGLLPGSYRWLATSAVASAVSGRLHIPDPPVAAVNRNPVKADEDVVQADGTTTAGTTTAGTTTAGPTAGASPAPQHSNDSSQHRPTPQPNSPKDPDTRPPPPVG